MRNINILIILSVLMGACSTTDHRDVASVTPCQKSDAKAPNFCAPQSQQRYNGTGPIPARYERF